MTQEQAESPYQILNEIKIRDLIISNVHDRPAFHNGRQPLGFSVVKRGNRELLIRWYGPAEQEAKHLNKYTDMFHRLGFQVKRINENSLIATSEKQIKLQKERRNREAILVKKLQNPERHGTPSKKRNRSNRAQRRSAERAAGQ